MGDIWGICVNNERRVCVCLRIGDVSTWRGGVRNCFAVFRKGGGLI